MAVKKTGRRNNENGFSSFQRGKRLASFPLMQFFFLVLFIGKLSARQTIRLKRQVRGKRGMRKIFIKDIFNILLLSHIQTTWNQLSPASFWLAVHPFSPERSFVLHTFHLWKFCILHIFLILLQMGEANLSLLPFFYAQAMSQWLIFI